MSSDDAPPNILFVFTDQQRHDWVGMNPDVPVRTPNLTALAERGIWFRNAICPSPLCGPSRASLASGYRYDRCGMPHHDTTYPVESLPPYTVSLRDDAGYHTMGCGKFLDKFFPDRGLDGTHRIDDFGFVEGTNSYGKWASVGTVGDPKDPYQAYLEERGLASVHYEDFRNRQAFDTHPTPLPQEAYNDNWIGQTGLDLLENAPSDQPWYLQVCFAGPHDPVDVTEDMHGWYRDPDVTFPKPVDPAGEYNTETHQEIRRNYAAMVENIDRWLGRYLDAIEHRGELSNTLVVFSSDHGEMLGDHGRWKKQSPYQHSLGVPLVVAGAGVNDREPIDSPATILDLHATFLEYAGLAPGPDLDSRSLAPVLRGEVDGTREHVCAGLGPWRLIFDGRYKLVTGYDPSRRVEYDLTFGGKDQVSAFFESDDDLADVRTPREPILWDVREHERDNLAEEYPERVQQLRDRLDRDCTPD